MPAPTRTCCACLASLNPPATFTWSRSARRAGARRHSTLLRAHIFAPRSHADYGPRSALELRASRLGSSEAELRLLRDVAKGLAHLHSRRIIHRDLTLRSVHLRDSGEAFICDLALAEPLPELGAADSSVADAGASVSLQPVLRWSAPVHARIRCCCAWSVTCVAALLSLAQESVQRGEYSAKTDVYMFGMLAVELLTGRPPYADDDDDTARDKIIRGVRPPEMSQLHRDAPLDRARCAMSLAAITGTLLAADPAQRPALCDVIRQCEAILSGADEHVPQLVVPLKPESSMERTRNALVSCKQLRANSASPTENGPMTC